MRSWQLRGKRRACSGPRAPQRHFTHLCNVYFTNYLAVLITNTFKHKHRNHPFYFSLKLSLLIVFAQNTSFIILMVDWLLTPSYKTSFHSSKRRLLVKQKRTYRTLRITVNLISRYTMIHSINSTAFCDIRYFIIQLNKIDS